ncbi:MAG TPA: polysaccharide deacetylase, partial [Geobacteraceae bacterium]|nr:polysaccharide deacetylase [Geobacteraceae bacterium]
FIKALDRHTAPPYKLQNHGTGHSDLPGEGFFLTVDMCPSRRPFEKAFFTAVADLSRQNRKAAPMAIAMSGTWLETHKDELAWIVQEIRRGKLAVTWINHSYNHFYDPKAPLARNFLLSPGTDFEREVLATEVLMLENGLLPSPFFRFPGLVADGGLVKKLRSLSLIPIGSDAWLAKGEVPKGGSFILVHGNGNEPQGIARILPLLQDNHGVRLLPLAAAFTSESSGGTGLFRE